MTESAGPFFSAIICTYNRSSLLKNVLYSFERQSLATCHFEVLVVDNNSSDDTSEVVGEFIARNSNFRYVNEGRVGVSYARNRGYLEAEGLYLAYTDDECIVPDEWLEVAFEVINQTGCGLAGGPVYPYYISEKPKWFKDDYGLFTFGPAPKLLVDHECFFGASLIMRRNLVVGCDGFDVQLGMKGYRIGYSEEPDLQRRIRIRFPAEFFYYDPKLFVHHAVRPEKMNLKWIIRSYTAKGFSNYQMALKLDESYKNLSRPFLVWYMLITLGYISAHLVNGLLFRSRGKYPYLINYIIERMHGHFKKLSFLASQWKHNDLLK